MSESVQRHRLAAGRRAMQDTFEKLCELVAKTGVCHQCRGLRDRAVQTRGSLPVLPSDCEQSFDERLAIVRSADLATGESAELHRIMFRAVRQVGEAPV